jgi:DNA topoisomerase-2
VLENFKEYHTNNRVNFELKFCEGVLESWKDSTLRQLKLVSSISMNNLVLFSPHGKLTRFKNVQEILQEFYTVRLEGYSLRKEYLLSRLRHDLEILSNKLRFIREVVDSKLEIRNVQKLKICQTLFDRGYTRSCDFIKIKSTKLNEKPAEDKPKEDEES